MEIEPRGVDVHGHAAPPSFLDEVADRGLAGVTVEKQDGYVVTFPGAKPLRKIGGIMLDFEDRLDWLHSEGMDRQIIAPWLDIHGQELPDRDGNVWVRSLNDAMAEETANSAGRLYSYATLHLGDPRRAAEELARGVEELGMVGTMLPTHPPQGSLADSAYDALWEAASSLAAPVVLHPPTIAPSRHLFDLFPQFRGTFGRGLDTTLAAAELIVTGVLDRFPDLLLVLVHGGGLLPYQVGRFDRDFGRGQNGEQLGRYPSEYVASMYFDSVLMSGSSMKLLFDLAGANHVMIGSDYGARPKERAGVALVDGLEAADPDEADRNAVLHETADRLFFDR